MERRAYALDMAWPAILHALGVRPSDVLRRAGLPEDLLASSSASLESEAYFRFWTALEALAGEGRLPLRLYEVLRTESFSPPLFAALCSPNLAAALRRLSQYKVLIAPMRLEIDEAKDTVAVRPRWLERALPPPPSLVVAELLFFVYLARAGTREQVSPLAIVTSDMPVPKAPYEELIGCAFKKGAEHAVVFSKADALRPFLSSNDSMWAIFEPALRKRVAELDASATTTERVRATLLEGIPSGGASIEEVAQRLALSKRTLQRRLEDEGTSFQKVLRDTREALARHYLGRTQLPVAEISFLLGFEEPNSFFRAFNEWTGATPEAVRKAAVSSG